MHDDAPFIDPTASYSVGTFEGSVQSFDYARVNAAGFASRSWPEAPPTAPPEELAGLLPKYVARRTRKAPDGINRQGKRNARSRLRRIWRDCRWRTTHDISADVFETWIQKQRFDMSPANINEYRMELLTFVTWLVQHHKLRVNPILCVAPLDPRTPDRRKRRAITQGDFKKLLYVARWRPLAEAGRTVKRVPPAEQKRRKRASWTYQPLTLDGLQEALATARGRLSPKAVQRFEWHGRERQLIYLMLAYTGLRRGELKSLVMRELFLDEGEPRIEFDGRQTKNRKEAVIPLRADLAEHLRAFLADAIELAKDDRHWFGKCLPGRVLEDDSRLSMDSPVFHVSLRLLRSFDADLALAGISKKDERGRGLDIHALRKTFATWLSTSNVAPRVAQEALRHSTIDLTMNTYTDAAHLDVRAAVEALPALIPSAGGVMP